MNLHKTGVKKNNQRVYKIWQGMRQRCENEHDKDFHKYGGRGITVCDEWKKSSQAFVEWALANGYKPTLSIDRKNVNGNYCPENCRWATPTEQARNRRVSKTNKFGAVGIHMDRGKYRAIIYANNRRIDLGRHETLEAALEARRAGELKYWSDTNEHSKETQGTGL